MKTLRDIKKALAESVWDERENPAPELTEEQRRALLVSVKDVDWREEEKRQLAAVKFLLTIFMALAVLSFAAGFYYHSAGLVVVSLWIYFFAKKGKFKHRIEVCRDGKKYCARIIRRIPETPGFFDTSTNFFVEVYLEETTRKKAQFVLSSHGVLPPPFAPKYHLPEGDYIVVYYLDKYPELVIPVSSQMYGEK